MVHTDTVAPAVVPSHLGGHLFSADIADTVYNFRVLRLNGSLFVYIGPVEQEQFQELALAMPTPDGTSVTTTTIMGASINSSNELAANFARRLQKQVFVSCNVPEDRDIRPALTRRFVQEVREFPDKF